MSSEFDNQGRRLDQADTPRTASGQAGSAVSPNFHRDTERHTREAIEQYEISLARFRNQREMHLIEVRSFDAMIAQHQAEVDRLRETLRNSQR